MLAVFSKLETPVATSRGPGLEQYAVARGWLLRS